MARFTDNDGASYTTNPQPTTIRVTPHTELPVIVLNVEPTSGEIPLTVTFDASQSYDPDGEIVLYEWFVDGQTLSSPTLSVLQHTFQEPGFYRNWLRLTDNLEGKARVDIDITAYITAGDWRMIGRDSRHTSRSSWVGPESPQEVWVADISHFWGVNDRYFAGPPVFAKDGTAYLQRKSGSPIGIDINGNLSHHYGEYSYPVPYSETMAVSEDDGTIYFPAGGALLALQSWFELKWVLKDVRDEEGKVIQFPGNPVIGPDGTVYIIGNTPSGSSWSL